jgi:hypothetical protein
VSKIFLPPSKEYILFMKTIFLFWWYYDIYINTNILYKEGIMEARKCLRCGIFHLGNDDVCTTCKENDMKDIAKLNSFMDYNGLKFKELQEKEAFDKVVFELGMSSEKITRYMNTYIKNDVYGNDMKKGKGREII